jgi:hypothetical protein
MKKNTAMRLASALLVLTLVSTSIISGTFAKYVTSDTASDTARVAKWGVVATVQGSLFGKSYYEKNQTATSNQISTKVENHSAGIENTVSSDDYVVAPGTASGQAMTIGVAGTPEVDTAVNLEISGSDIWLAEGHYGVLETAGAATFTNGEVVYSGDVTADNFTSYYVLNGTTFSHPTTEITSGSVFYYGLINEVEFTADGTSVTNGKSGDNKVDVSADTRFVVENGTSKYYPIIWSAQIGYNTPVTYSSINSIVGTDVDSTYYYEAGTNFLNDFDAIRLTWEWPFDYAAAVGSSNYTAAQLNLVDNCDIILGDLMSAEEIMETGHVVVCVNGDICTLITVDDNGVATAGDVTVANLTVSVNASISATQVD